MIRNWHPFDVVDLQPSSSKLQPSNEAIGVDWCVRPSRFLTFVGRRRRRGEGGGYRDIRAGYERVLQEVQNVIFDIPKSFQLIKAPLPLPPVLNVPGNLKGCWKLRPPVISRQRELVGQLLANTALPALFGSNLIFAHYSKLARLPSSPAAVLAAGCWKSW